MTPLIPYFSIGDNVYYDIRAIKKIDKHSISVDDCLQNMQGMEPKSVDIVVTSPPYNIGKEYNNYDDKKPQEAYLLWMENVAESLARVLKDDGSIFLNVGSTNIDPWIAYDVAARFRKYFVLQNHIMWAKSISINDQTYGHFKPISSKRFLNQNHESIFHFTFDGKQPVDRLSIGVPYMDKSNIKRRNHAQDKRCNGNTWFIPYDTVQSKAEKFDHPAGFPIGLPINCIKLTGKTNAVVLDPFMGTGTTLIAAHRLGHVGIGIDIDNTYAATAEKRLLGEINDI